MKCDGGPFSVPAHRLIANVANDRGALGPVGLAVKRVKYLVVANGQNDARELGCGGVPVALDAEIALEGLEVHVMETGVKAGLQHDAQVGNDAVPGRTMECTRPR